MFRMLILEKRGSGFSLEHPQRMRIFFFIDCFLYKSRFLPTIFRVFFHLLACNFFRRMAERADAALEFLLCIWPEIYHIMYHTPSFENLKFSNIFRTRLGRIEKRPRNRLQNPKMIQKHMPQSHAYILSFFKKSTKSIINIYIIDISIDIDFRKKEKVKFSFFILYPTHQRSSKSDVAFLSYDRGQTQSHKAFFTHMS